MRRSSAKLDTEDWESGVGYNRGRVVRSLSNNHKYVRIVAGAGTTDPASDYTNWKPEDPNVPWRITTYTSGTGTYVPLTDNARCEVTIQGAGSSGQRAAAASFASGGAAGATIVKVPLRIPIAGVAYVVGAGGASKATTGDGNAGSPSKFAGLIASGGGEPSSGRGGYGGVVGDNFYTISGGGGGRTSASSQSSSPAGFYAPAQGNGKANSAYGHGSGGSSVFALGGDGGATTGANAVAGEKGSGGGGTDAPGISGPGGDGFIIVVEYGA